VSVTGAATDAAEPAPPTGPARSARRVGGAVGELVAAAVLAALVAVVGLWAVGRVDFPAFTTSHLTRALTTVGQVVTVALAGAGLWLLRRDTASRWGRALGGIGIAGLTTVTLALPLSATRLYLFGVSVDQQFRTQYLTRTAATAQLTDMNYADTPPYYPAGWFWLGGRLASWTDTAGWAMYKPWSILSLAVAATVSAALWARLVRPHLAVAIGLAQTGLALAYASPEPYGAVVALLLPPVTVLAWRALRPGGHWAGLVATGVFLGVSATFYTLYTGLAAMTVVLMALVAAGLAVAAAARTHSVSFRSGAALRAGLGPVVRLLAVAVLAGAIALIAWGPFLVRRLTAESGPATAMRYLPEAGARLPLPMLQISLLGLLTITGLIWIVWRIRTSVIAQAFALTVVAIYLWVLASMTLTALGTTLLGFRLEPVLLLVLGAAGTLAAADLTRWARARAGAGGREKSADRVRAVTAAAAIVALAGTLAFVQDVPDVLSTEISVAYRDTDGDGERADRYAPGPASYYGEIAETIDSQVPTPPQETVVLTTEAHLLSFFPYRGFQAISSHYANPLGMFDARTDEIIAWSQSADPAELLARLDDSPWQAPQAFVFRADGDDYTLKLSEDVYPNDPNVRTFPITFPAALFDAPEFSVSTIGPFTVIVRR